LAGGVVVDRDDGARGGGVGPGEQRVTVAERTVEHGGLALGVQRADLLDVEPELLDAPGRRH